MGVELCLLTVTLHFHCLTSSSEAELEFTHLFLGFFLFWSFWLACLFCLGATLSQAQGSFVFRSYH